MPIDDDAALRRQLLTMQEQINTTSQWVNWLREFKAVQEKTNAEVMPWIKWLSGETNGGTQPFNSLLQMIHNLQDQMSALSSQAICQPSANAAMQLPQPVQDWMRKQNQLIASVQNDVRRLNDLCTNLSKQVAQMKQQTGRASQTLGAPTREVVWDTTAAPSEKRTSPATSSFSRQSASHDPSRTDTASVVLSHSLVECQREYDRLPVVSTFQNRKIRDDFLQKYQIIALACKNQGARMKNPEEPPVFAESSDLLGDPYWAMPLGGGRYAVFPRSHLPYDSTIHNASAMGKAFTSNYMTGSYNDVEVRQPAIFQNRGGQWAIAERGELRLRQAATPTS